MLNINDVVLEGVIVHKFVTEKVAILTIDTGKSTPAKNFPKVLYFGEFIQDVNKNYNVGDSVKITGNIQSSRRDPNIKNQNTVSIFGESIEASKPTGIDENGKRVFNEENSFVVAGMVTHTEKTFDNLVRIRISTKKNGRQSYVNAMYYTNDPDSVINSFEKGDNVKVIGTVQTAKKNNNGETRFFENYVIAQIKKI